MPSLHIENLSVTYPKQQHVVLDSINLKVYQGELVVLLGENGVGKSTLLKSIAGLLTASLGTIQLYDKPIERWNKRELAKQMSWVDTQLSFSDYISVEEFIAYGRYPFTNWLGKLQNKDVECISEAIADCGLTELKGKSMARLSDGEKQKVFIARALAQKTSILLLDEPTTHLDVKNTAGIFSLLKKQSKREGKTIIFSSHKFENALHIADKIWLFNGNGIISTTPDEFRKSQKLQQLLLDNYVVFDEEKEVFRWSGSE